MGFDEEERPFFASAAKGTEGALRDELRELRIPRVKADRGGVHFGGDGYDAMRVCFESRIAVRVLWRRGRFYAESGDELYEKVRDIDLSDVLEPNQTLSVAANVKNGQLTHTGFVAQRTKDALVDAQRVRYDARSNVSRENPDVRVVVHIVKDEAELFLDVSGEALHRRGYRTDAREAPIKETLAASMLRLCGWDRERPLVDPMCGSGTIAIEAALWARNIAPGLLGRTYGFQRWASYDDSAKLSLNQIRDKARAKIKPEGPVIVALDTDQVAVDIARKMARNAGVMIQIEAADVRDFGGSEPPGHIVTNPPYGVRIARGEGFEEMLADTFGELSGHRVSVICQDRNLEQAMKRPPAQEHALWNGDLECRLYSWDVP